MDESEATAIGLSAVGPAEIVVDPGMVEMGTVGPGIVLPIEAMTE